MSATRMNFDIFAYHLSTRKPEVTLDPKTISVARQWIEDCVAIADAFEIAHPKYFDRMDFLRKCDSEYWKSRGKGRQIPKRWCK